MPAPVPTAAAPPPPAPQAAAPPPQALPPAPPVAPAPEPIAPRPSVVKAEPETLAAMLIQQSTPKFPARAKRAGFTNGIVVVELTIDERGVVRSPRVVSAEPKSVFDDAALEAVQEWRYRPKIVDGVPVASKQRVTFRFK
jgi:protein TonB